MESHKTNIDTCEDKLRELLPTLPKYQTNSLPAIYQYQGFWYIPTFIDGIFSLHQSFRALSTDIIIAGGFKSGNTWLKSLCFSIATRHQFPDIFFIPLPIFPDKNSAIGLIMVAAWFSHIFMVIASTHACCCLHALLLFCFR